MTDTRLRQTGGEHSPPPHRNLKLIVPLILASVLVWLALISPNTVPAIGLGISALYLLYRMDDN